MKKILIAIMLALTISLVSCNTGERVYKAQVIDVNETFITVKITDTDSFYYNDTYTFETDKTYEKYDVVWLKRVFGGGMKIIESEEEK